MLKKLISILLLFLTSLVQAQSIDHWETIVNAEQTWQYFLGNSEPNTNWNTLSFDDSSWLSGPGGIGYGDGDDNTIIDPVLSLYMRIDFTVVDQSAMVQAIFHADYDDAFVAYLNGVEIARANIGTVGDSPTYNTPANEFVEPRLVNGQLPAQFTISNNELNNLLNQGSNTLAIQVHNHQIESSDLSSIFYLSVGISDESFNYFPTPSWFVPSFESSNLPILIIDTDNNIEIPDEPKINAHLGIIANENGMRNSLGDPFNNYDGDIAIEIRGASSQFFDKKGYGFETRNADGSNNNVPLLGMPAENDWVLHGPYSDKSLMRNVLTYHISSQMGRYAPRTRYCELILNDQYQGIYVLVEKVKRDVNRVDISKLRVEDIEGDELTGGYIVQIDRDNDVGWTSSFLDFLYYAYHYPDPDDMAEVQRNYIRNYINSFETAVASTNFLDPEVGYQKYMDVDAFIDYWISNELAKEVDAYRLSFYMYKKKDSNGGKLHMGPVWDFNLGYGNFDYCDEAPVGWAHEFNVTCGSPHPFWISKLLGVPDIQNRIHCRWDSLRQTVLTTEKLIQYIDSTALVLEEAQERNFNRWNVLGRYIWPNSFVGDTYEEELDFMKDWLVDRLNWMDNNMLGSCIPTSTSNILNDNAIQVFPNPFEDDIHIQVNQRIDIPIQIRLYDVVGRLLSIHLLDGQTIGITSWNIEQLKLTNGVYFYEVSTGKEMLTQGKLIKKGD